MEVAGSERWKPTAASELGTPGSAPRARPRSKGVHLGASAAILFALALLIIPSTGILGVRASPVQPNRHVVSQLQLFQRNIQHIVYIQMENHAFDNYFGVYCPAVRTNCPAAVRGIPPGTCVPLNPSVGTTPCATPYNYTAMNLSITSPMPHNQVASLASWNHGAMNGFYLAERSGLDPFGHYNGTTAPLYWDLAQEYGLGDSFFSTSLSYSLPNHWFLLAGSAPKESVNSTLVSAADKSIYLRQANDTTSAENLLSSRPSVSWKYYDYALPTWSAATNSSSGIGTTTRGAYNYWNPLAAQYQSYGHREVSHFVPNTQFFSDAANGTLPSVSWVVPFSKQSDHPPANVTASESWVASAVDAVESSSEWDSTAIFLFWDDYGGWYDGVTPPYVNGSSLSFRVPLLVISPYTPAGTVVNTNGSFPSLLALAEQTFGLGCITVLDCQATLPLGYFDFNLSARSPVLFSTTPGLLTYPATVKAATPGALNSWRPSVQFTDDPNGTGPDVD